MKLGNLAATAMAVAATLTAVSLTAPPTASAANTLTMLGADVSTLQRSNELGLKFFDAAGAQKDALDILKANGVNYARLRVWNNPASGYNNAAKVLAYAKTVKAKGSSCWLIFITRTPGPTRASSTSRRPGPVTALPSCRRTSTTTRTTSAPA